jgi:acetyltransferase-like isoleucine patch superfamily enzyme
MALTKWGIADALRIRGLFKSLYYSFKHTQRPGRLLLGKRVITEIDSDATIDLNSRFLMSITSWGSSHAHLGRSKLEVQAGGKFCVTSDDGFALIGPCSVVHVEGTFGMGNSFITSDCRIVCEDEISIGDGCAISWNVEMLDSDRHQLIVDGDPQSRTAPIRIEDDVWIGHDVSISKGVTIGEGAVVASDSVVLDDVPPGTLVAGAPAETIEEDVDWE